MGMNSPMVRSDTDMTLIPYSGIQKVYFEGKDTVRFSSSRLKEYPKLGREEKE